VPTLTGTAPATALSRHLPFSVACLLELALLFFAYLWSWPFHRSALLDLNWGLNATIIGIVAAIPPFLFFVWTLNSNLLICSLHRHPFESVLRPLFAKWSVLHRLIISLIAGLSEEAFIRGAMQESLADRVAVIPALVLASAAFGACHLLTWDLRHHRSFDWPEFRAAADLADIARQVDQIQQCIPVSRRICRRLTPSTNTRLRISLQFSISAYILHCY
jgi:membrane protease YdiL (CAAX protease family)